MLPGEEEEFAFDFPDPEKLAGSHGALVLQTVKFGYRRDGAAPTKILFDNLDFSVNMDSRTVIVGPNGKLRCLTIILSFLPAVSFASSISLPSLAESLHLCASWCSNGRKKNAYGEQELVSRRFSRCSLRKTFLSVENSGNLQSYGLGTFLSIISISWCCGERH